MLNERLKLINTVNSGLKGESRTYFFESKHGDKVTISLYKNSGEAPSLHKYWFKYGFTKVELGTHIVLVTDVLKNDYYLGWYNPCFNPDNGKLNFDYIMEWNENNIIYLLNKSLEMADEKSVKEIMGR